jgi:hypothetical protein
LNAVNTHEEILARINEIRISYFKGIEEETNTEKDTLGWAYELESLSFEFIYYYLQPMAVEEFEAEAELEKQKAEAHFRSREGVQVSIRNKIDIARKEWTKDSKYLSALIDFRRKKENYWRHKMLMDKVDRLCNKMKYLR